MEEQLFTKLPSGATWWTVQHPAALSHVQTPYDSDASVISKVTMESRRAPQADEQRTAMVAPSKKAPSKLPMLMEAILEAVDPCFSLYTSAQRKDALHVLRTRLLNFVVGPAHPYIGPKKSRVLSSWLTGNKLDVECGGIIHEFVSFLLDERAATWVIGRTQHGEWYVKN